MNLQSTILVATVASVNAQGIVPTLFNLFSGFFVEQFNNLAGEVTQSIDPFDLNFDQSVSLEVGSCSEAVVTTSFTIEQLSGLSTVEVSKIAMTAFTFGLPTFDVGFELEAGLESLSATLSGTISEEGCEVSDTLDFTGTASLTGADLEFGLNANMTIAAGFSLDSIEIPSFSLTWDDLGVSTSDLGPLNSAKDVLEDALVSAVTTAVSSLVNAQILEDAAALIVPFTIP